MAYHSNCFCLKSCFCYYYYIITPVILMRGRQIECSTVYSNDVLRVEAVKTITAMASLCRLLGHAGRQLIHFLCLHNRFGINVNVERYFNNCDSSTDYLIIFNYLFNRWTKKIGL